MDKPFYAAIIFLVMAYLYKNNYPKLRSRYWGYRTFQSMKSDENWDYANRTAGLILFCNSLLVFTVSLVGNLFNLDYLKIFYGLGATITLFMFFYIEYKLKFSEKKF
jgi:uncharacterized membrane protein